MAAPAARLLRAPTRVVLERRAAAVVARDVGGRQSRAVVTPSLGGLGNPYSHTFPHRARQGSRIRIIARLQRLAAAPPPNAIRMFFRLLIRIYADKQAR